MFFLYNSSSCTKKEINKICDWSSGSGTKLHTVKSNSPICYWSNQSKAKHTKLLIGDESEMNSNAHYDDVIMTMLASQITSLTVVYSIVYSGVNQRKHQSSASLAFVREIHRGPVNFPHKWPVTRKMFPFDDVTMKFILLFTWFLSFFAGFPAQYYRE